MIAFLEGVLEEALPTQIVVNVHGVELPCDDPAFSDEPSQRSWAERLADILFAATPKPSEFRHAMV